MERSGVRKKEEKVSKNIVSYVVSIAFLHENYEYDLLLSVKSVQKVKIQENKILIPGPAF